MSQEPRTIYAIMSRDRVGDPTESSLSAAAARAGLTYVPLVIDDIALDDLVTMQFEPNSLLYRLSVKSKASAIESALFSLYPDTFTTIRIPRPALGPTRRYGQNFSQIAAGLPIIPSSMV